jgi:hypothetical protein
MKHVIIERISKSRGGYGSHRVSLIGLGTPGYGQFRHIRMGKDEKSRMSREKSKELSIERKEQKEVYGVALD